MAVAILSADCLGVAVCCVWITSALILVHANSMGVSWEKPEIPASPIGRCTGAETIARVTEGRVIVPDFATRLGFVDGCWSFKVNG